MAQPITISLKVVVPWWWSTAVWLSATPYLIRYALTGKEPTEAETQALIGFWTRRLRFTTKQ